MATDAATLIPKDETFDLNFVTFVSKVSPFAAKGDTFIPEVHTSYTKVTALKPVAETFSTQGVTFGTDTALDIM